MEAESECYAPSDTAANLIFAWLVVPSMWACRPHADVESQARRDFNVTLVEVPMRKWSMEYLQLLKGCFGALLYREPGSLLPFGVAQVCDYFFARDRRESLVYTWLPREKRFRIVDQDWVNLRRGAA